jgi:hypothetical protein
MIRKPTKFPPLNQGAEVPKEKGIFRLAIFASIAFSGMSALCHADGGNRIATDENLGTQWFQIPSWDMTKTYPIEWAPDGSPTSYGSDLAFYQNSTFTCGKEISIGTEILSDPTGNNQPYMEPFARLNTYNGLKNTHGGEVDARCFTDNPSYVSFQLLQHWVLPTLDYGPLFVHALTVNYPTSFQSTNVPRGWVKVEYFK